MKFIGFFGISVAKFSKKKRFDLNFKVAKSVLKNLNVAKFKIRKPVEVAFYSCLKRVFVFQWGDKSIG
ncbi:hypothetical protein ASJ34_16565 [Xanthomonas campestris pv. campestris]|nr:hypothetical protein ASJ34_16565 [Xanthomonas campestris pv. campestris]